MPRLYPRATLKRIVRAYEPEYKLSKNVDIKIYVLYLLFLQRLISEANRQAQMNRESVLQAKHITSAMKIVLQQFKG